MGRAKGVGAAPHGAGLLNGALATLAYASLQSSWTARDPGGKIAGMNEDELIAFGLELTTLKRVPRSGWLLRGVPHVESVAEHAYGTATLALALCDILNASGELAHPLDVERVLTIALLHDLAEARLTDLPGPARLLIPDEVKSRAETIAMTSILTALPSAARLLSAWREFEEDSTPEGCLVRDADKLEMMLQCTRYERSGVRGLDEFWVAVDAYLWHYPLCAAVYARLKARRNA